MIEEFFITRLEHYLKYLKLYTVPNDAIAPERIENLYKEMFFLLDKLKTLNSQHEAELKNLIDNSSN